MKTVTVVETTHSHDLPKTTRYTSSFFLKNPMKRCPPNRNTSEVDPSVELNNIVQEFQRLEQEKRDYLKEINQLIVEDQQLVERGNEVLCLEYQILAIKLKLLEFSVVRTQVVYEIEERDRRINQKRLQLKKCQNEYTELRKLDMEENIPKKRTENSFQNPLMRLLVLTFFVIIVILMKIIFKSE
ncbi:hypothetical protein K7432_003779 [Basidiobolus ranarum]|uniref:Transmembrane protein n=1 Tax=Basidiobolus ranarum TaxID=34480 RepID=A0ABR2WZA4_9FUNG